MTTIREAVLNVLLADTALMALATGGVHDADSIDNQDGLQPDALQTGDSPIIQPGIYVEWISEDPFGVNDATLHAERLFFLVNYYQHVGYSTIIAMRGRVKRLLHQQRVDYDTPANEYCHAIIWAGDVLNQTDDEMSEASLEWSRFEVHIRRQDY